MTGEVEVRNVFHVKGRGAVAIGYLRRGTVRAGQRTGPLVLEEGKTRVLTLEAVETMHAADGGIDALGLVFRERPSLDGLRAALPPGTVLRLQDVPETGADLGSLG